ncbi:MAG: glycosyltransferase family 1 protein, partial [Acidobacteriota bacterium]
YNISPQKIHVAYLAGNDLYYDETDEGRKPNATLPDRYVFYPANRWFHKNHDNLLKALLIIKKESGIEVPCLFTGFDYEKGYQLNEKIKEYVLSGQARSIGYVTLEEMKYLYKHAEMLCFPSLFEGFGMPPVEAMASGCPVICSNTTSLPEVVGDAALVFDPTDPRDIADKIVKLWNDEQLRQEFIGLGKVQAQKFSVKKMADDHIRAFNQAAGSFSRKKYLYHKYIYEPLHILRMKPKKVMT